MARSRALLLVLLFAIGGCTALPSYTNNVPRERAACPSGTMMICQTDSLHGCSCGRLVHLY